MLISCLLQECSLFSNTQLTFKRFDHIVCLIVISFSEPLQLLFEGVFSKGIKVLITLSCAFQIEYIL